MEWLQEFDIAMAAETELAHIVAQLRQVRWTYPLECSIVERRIALTTLRQLQSAAAGIVPPCHRELVVFAETHYTSSATCIVGMAAAFAHLESNRGRRAANFPESVVLHIAALEGSHSLLDPVG